jgi:hypothetical protein
MAGALHKWWRAGEEGAVAVYRRDMVVPVIGMSLIASLILAGFYFLGNSLQWSAVVTGLIAAIPVTTAIAYGRIAMIFTETAVLYRAISGPPRQVPFQTIVKIKNVTNVDYPGLAGFGRGIVLYLDSGETLNWRLGINNENEALERLGRATGIPVGNGIFAVTSATREATATGENNYALGIYRSQCCSDERTIEVDQKFPLCGRCGSSAIWLLVKDISNPVEAQRHSRERNDYTLPDE